MHDIERNLEQYGRWLETTSDESMSRQSLARHAVHAVPRGPRSRVAAGAAAVVAFLGLGAAGVVWLARAHEGVDRPTAATADGETTAAPVDVTIRLLEIFDNTEPPGSLSVASTASQLDALRQSLQLDRDLGPVDFAEELVLVITIPDTACRRHLSITLVEGASLTPSFAVDGSAVCDLAMIPTSYVVAIARRDVPALFRVEQPLESAEYSTTAVLVDLGELDAAASPLIARPPALTSTNTTVP
jgi:hypothetical protein